MTHFANGKPGYFRWVQRMARSWLPLLQFVHNTAGMREQGAAKCKYEDKSLTQRHKGRKGGGERVHECSYQFPDASYQRRYKILDSRLWINVRSIGGIGGGIDIGSDDIKLPFLLLLLATIIKAVNGYQLTVDRFMNRITETPPRP